MDVRRPAAHVERAPACCCGFADPGRGKWSYYAIDREAVAAAWRDLHALLRI